MSGGIRVLIVDDHPLVREGLRQVLAEPEFLIVGEAGAGLEAIELAASCAAEVAVLDINLPGEHGIDVARRLLSQSPSIRILMLSVHDHPEYVVESLKAGAHGYLRKDSLPAQLRDAVRAVHAGRTAFAAGSSCSGSEATTPVLTAASQRVDLLTRRERDVLIGVATGKLNKEMAAELGLSVRTIESYRESLMRKLGIPNAAGLTRFAIEAHLLGR